MLLCAIITYEGWVNIQVYQPHLCGDLGFCVNLPGVRKRLCLREKLTYQNIFNSIPDCYLQDANIRP